MAAHNLEQLVTREHQLGHHCHKLFERIDSHANGLIGVLCAVVFLGGRVGRRRRGFGRFYSRRVDRRFTKRAFEIVERIFIRPQRPFENLGDLLICGLDPMLSAETLGVIGGFNVLGSLFFGWAGGAGTSSALLGGIYISRSLVLALYFMMPPTPATTLVFGAFMGFLWLGVGPLVAGAVAELFGLQWQAMIQGLAFMSHQLGSFLGAYGGGLIYDALGSYNMAWRIGVAVGLAAGIIQVAFALIKPTAPPVLRTA